MLAPRLPEWLVRLTRASGLPEAATALAEALTVLAAEGIVVARGDEREPWLVVERGGQVLALSLRAAVAPGDSVRELVANLFGALLLRAAAEEDHRRSRERLAMLSGASFEGIIIHVDGIVIDCNQRLSELIGYTREEFIGADIARLCVAPEDLPDVLYRVSNRIEGEYLVTGIRKDGTRFRAELLSKQGQLGERPVRVVAVRDVTERERTHALLREGEARFRDLTEATFDFTVYSRDSIIVDARGDTMGQLGLTREEMLGRSLFELIAPSALPATRAMVTNRRYGSYETVAIGPGGELVPTQVIVVASTLNGEPVRVAGIRDLRPARRLEGERRALQQQVERAQRLDSLGVLAGGIAHDFNNLLAGMLGNAEILRDTATTDDDGAAARAIITATHRAAALTRQMLAYAGQRDLGRRDPIDLSEVLSELGALLDATLSKKARVRFAIEPDSIILGDRATIGQVFMNLLTNASDALGDDAGQIDVRARRVQKVDARWDAAQGATVGPGQWILVEVADTGVGMDEHTRGRVFEPFFSTKETGHGLGLAACLGIISAHGGAVLVESERGRGSCFSVLLPASDGDARAPDAVRPASATPCRVLVVDDEAIVRTQLRRTLELRGYSVVEAPDGRGALALLDRGDHPRPDVIILDMTMPDIDGAEVLQRLRASGSQIPVVVSSGYLDASIERRLPRGEFQGFLAKPYGATDLVSAIERARAAGPRTNG